MKIIEQLEVTPNIPKQKMLDIFGSDIQFDKDLSQFSSYQTGGPAKYFVSAQTAEILADTVKSALEYKIPFFVIGGGSNLLISDNGYNGMAIKVDIKGIKLVPGNMINCGAGENLMDLICFAADNSLSGIEFASGIWGTVGGAIFGNAGAYGGEIKDILENITLIDTKGEIKEVSKEYCQFGYRDSYLKKTREIVVSALFKLNHGDKQLIKAKIDEIIKIRSEKHPVDGKTAGCFFKNIPDSKEKYGKLPAGKLLEEIGAKGLRVGGAAVFDKHANMIVNTGNATSKDIRDLADILKKKVFEKFGIELEEEVVQVGKIK